MTSEELAKLYAEVVAVRPEAAIELQPPSNTCPDWWSEKHSVYISHDLAGAITLAHWLGMLPSEWCLTHIGEQWSVWCESEYKGDWEAPTPLEALAAFLKEKP